MDAEEREMKFRSHGARYDHLLAVVRHAAFGAD
jgi:hypothetical protein